MINLILWLVFGAIVGWLAGIVMRSPNGLVLNIITGIIGAFIGGFLLNRDVAANVFDIGSLVTAFIGAVVLLAVLNLFSRGRAR